MVYCQGAVLVCYALQGLKRGAKSWHSLRAACRHLRGFTASISLFDPVGHGCHWWKRVLGLMSASTRPISKLHVHVVGPPFHPAGNYCTTLWLDSDTWVLAILMSRLRARMVPQGLSTAARAADCGAAFSDTEIDAFFSTVRKGMHSIERLA